jgi:hypothetical protein
MGQKRLQPASRYVNLEDFTVYDDFVSFTDAQLWTVAVAATGTAAHQGPGRSNFRLFGTADNDPAVIATTHEIFKFTAGKAMNAQCSVVFVDHNTDDGAFGFGFADALAATTLADTTSAVTATDAALIYKPKNSLYWAFHTEVNGTATASTSTTAASSSAAQVLEIDIIARSSTELEARPKVDGVQLKTTGNVPIMHVIPVASATDLDFGAILKAGHADDLVALIDWVYASQNR